MWVSMVVCFYVGLQRAGNLSRVPPCLCPMTVGIGSHDPELRNRWKIDRWMDGWYQMSVNITINKFFIYIFELVEAGLAWHLLPVETQIPLEGISITPGSLLLEGEKKRVQTWDSVNLKVLSFFKMLSFTLLISLCFSRLTISSMISPSPRTSLQIKVHWLISITASMHNLNRYVTSCVSNDSVQSHWAVQLSPTWCVPSLGPPLCGSHFAWRRTPPWWEAAL